MFFIKHILNLTVGDLIFSKFIGGTVKPGMDLSLRSIPIL